MILKFKYYHDNGQLVPYQSYTLAQNSHLSSSISITSTDPDAKNYNYCLEFVCYNTKNIPKAQYISTVLQYDDNGINFDVPNNLTQYRGHTDIQLTGYDKLDNNVIFKSVAKSSKAFDVEGSLCVLENSISDTPNVITEILNQLDYLTDIKQNLVQEFMNSVNNDLNGVLSNYIWHKVEFLDRGNVVASGNYIKGSKLTPPEFTLPSGCVIDGGWYNLATDIVWDFDVNTVESDLRLQINYYTEGLVFQNSLVRDYSGTSTEVYIPRYFNNIMIKSAAYGSAGLKSNFEMNVYLNDLLNNITLFAGNSCFKNINVPATNPNLFFTENFIYDKDFKLVRVNRTFKNSVTLNCPALCNALAPHAINNITATKIICPAGLITMDSKSINNCQNLTELILPASFSKASAMAVYRCPNLNKIYILSPIPPELGNNAFVQRAADSDQVISHIPLYVPSQYFNVYANTTAYANYPLHIIPESIEQSVAS